MDIIVVSHTRGRTWRIALDPRRIICWLPLVAVTTIVLSLGFGAGMLIGGRSPDPERPSSLPSSLLATWSSEVRTQRTALEQARTEAERNSAALARRIAQLQAHVIRLDAAGQRLTEIAGLDSGEFSFGDQPPIGGPESAALPETGLDSLLASLGSFERQLSDRERQKGRAYIPPWLAYRM